jgi:hypothetical protein
MPLLLLMSFVEPFTLSVHIHFLFIIIFNLFEASSVCAFPFFSVHMFLCALLVLIAAKQQLA